VFRGFPNFFDQKAPSPQLLRLREKMKAKGRKHFIFTRGVLGFGTSVFVLSTISSWYEKYGWHAPPRADLSSNSIDIAFGLALWLTAGYVFGARIWRKMGLEESTSERPNSMIDALFGKRLSASSRLRRLP